MTRKRSGLRCYRNRKRWKLHMLVRNSRGGYGAACGSIGSGYELTEAEEDVSCQHCRRALPRHVEKALLERAP
jgi:hypothetical protein